MAPQSPTSWTRCRSDQGDRCSSRIMPSLRRWLTLTGQFTFFTFRIDKASELNLFRERIPERVVHAKGAGAFGYFEVNIFQVLSFKLWFNRWGQKMSIFLFFFSFLWASPYWISTRHGLKILAAILQVTHDISKYCKAAVFSKVLLPELPLRSCVVGIAKESNCVGFSKFGQKFQNCTYLAPKYVQQLSTLWTRQINLENKS